MKSTLLARLLGSLLLAYGGAATFFHHFQSSNPEAEKRWCRFLICDSELLLRTAYERLFEGGPEGLAGAVESYREALSRDPASAYRWCDLGEVSLDSGQMDQATYCFRHALELAPNTAPILVRAGNFQFRIGEPREAMRNMHRVLQQIPDYDSAIFSTYTRMQVPLDEIIRYGLPEDRRVARSFFTYLLAQGNVVDLQGCWKWMMSHSLLDDRLACDYINLLADKRNYATATQAWTEYLGVRRGDYPATNFLFNGGFEQKFTGAILDWKIEPCTGVVVTRDPAAAKEGTWSLAIEFEGNENISFSHIRQRATIRPGQRYRFQAYVRSKGITTDQGVGFRLSDPESPARLDLSFGNITGTQDWERLDQVFVAPAQTRALDVQVIRRPSLKFDNRISGSAWLDGVVLTAQ